jgi:hypothetical protein
MSLLTVMPNTNTTAKPQPFPKCSQTVTTRLVLLEPQLLGFGVARRRINALHPPKIKRSFVDVMFPIDIRAIDNKWLESLLSGC